MLLGVFWVWGVFGFGVWGTWRTPLSLRGRNEEVLAGGNKGPACLDSRHRIHNKSIVPHGARTHAPDYSCTLAASSRRCWPCRPTLSICRLDRPAPTSLTLPPPPPPPPLHPPTHLPPLHTHTHTHTINTYRRRAFHRAKLGPHPRRAPIASEHSTRVQAV